MGPASSSPPPPPPPLNPTLTPTPASIQQLVLRLVQPRDRADLRFLVDSHVAPDVVFCHTLGQFRGRQAYYSALRAATGFLWRYSGVTFDWRDSFVVEERAAKGGGGGSPAIVKAALAMVLHLRLPFLPRALSPALDFPTVALLRFERRHKDGPWLLARHVDANSLVALATALVPWNFAARWLLPLMGLCGVAVARALDAAADGRDALLGLGDWLLRPPQLMLD
jgi:hypothetical protein